MLKKMFLKWKLKQKNIIIDQNTFLDAKDVIFTGEKTTSYGAFISSSNVSGHLSLGEGTKIWGAVVAGNVTLERFSSVSGPSTWIRGFFDGVRIGAFSSIGMNCVILDYNHRFNSASQFNMNTQFFDAEYKNDLENKGKIVIEEDVWIGGKYNCIGGVYNRPRRNNWCWKCRDKECTALLSLCGFSC